MNYSNKLHYLIDDAIKSNNKWNNKYLKQKKQF